MNTTEIDDAMNELDNCGDKYCGNTITAKQIREEGAKFMKNVTKRCRSNTIPKNEKEDKMRRRKYDECFAKYKKRSNYTKKLTQRKKCEDTFCSIYQKKIQKIVASKKNH